MTTKLCLFCRHCDFDEGQMYSEWTADSPSINCAKGLNSFCSVEHRDFAEWSKKAETCPDYELDK